MTSTSEELRALGEHHALRPQVPPGRAGDLLAGAAWRCAATAPGAARDPSGLSGELEWIPARVPGTAAGALRDAGRFEVGSVRDLDAEDWWFRCRVPVASPGPNVLVLDGVATVADVWLDGLHVLNSTSMFLRHEVPLRDVRAGAELVLRCAALGPLLVRAGAPSRWRSGLVARQGLRSWRTALIGRVPVWPQTGAPVGPWRPVRIEPVRPGRLSARWISAGYENGAGRLEVRARLLAGQRDGNGAGEPAKAVLACAGREAPASARYLDGVLEVRGTLELPGVEAWWPRPYGEAVLHAVELILPDSSAIGLGRVGFRSLELDREHGAFALSCNGVRLFCRGVCWWPVDPVGLAGPAQATRRALEAIAGSGLNLVRITGWTCYEDDGFFDACDELGLLVWQDLMFGTLDLPSDDGFAELVGQELEQQLGRLAGRPSLALVSGSDEGESQPAMLGLAAASSRIEVLESALPEAAARLVPGVAVVTSTPTGGPVAFFPGSGSSHYFGVGSYRRPLSDARLAGVRFAAQCLAFAVPPERRSADRVAGAVHTVRDPRWLAGVPRDAGSSWDFGDVTDHYLAELFGTDPSQCRATDPDRYLALCRATCAVLVERVLSEWRRPGSLCDGAILESWRDVALGPGFGLLDADGVAKSTWYAMRRALAPLGCLLTDEGLNGLHLHVCNDLPRPAALRIVLRRFADGERVLEEGEGAVVVPARSATSLCLDELLPGFRDLTWSYRFGPPEHDVVGVTVRCGGVLVTELAHQPVGLSRAVEADLGLTAAIVGSRAAGYALEMSTRRFAQLVEVDVEGYRPEDSWFDLLPGASRRIALLAEGDHDGARPGTTGRPRRVLLRPLNCSSPTVASAAPAEHGTGSGPQPGRRSAR